MNRLGKITGNGTLADNPEKGSGVQHSFEIGTEVIVEKDITSDNGLLIRRQCSDGVKT